MPEVGERTRLLAAFAAVYVIWGSTYLAILYAIETLPPFLMAGARFLVAGAVLYGWARLRGVPRPRGLHWRSAAIVGAFLLLGGNGGVVWSEQRVPSGLAALLVATVPLWMVVFESLRPTGVRPGRGVWVGLALGLAGVALLVGRGELAGGRGADPLGAVVLIVASMSWACGSIYARAARLPESPLLATGMEMLSGGVLLTVAGLATGEWGRLALDQASPRSLWALLYLIVMGSLVGFTAYIYLLQKTTPALASTYAFVNPV
ncbi:MAG TPA: EamA family transporter, partial [Thermoanaerobaculia bacterium]|nr:EamA family transporter [Thermoanaerobaculia bacterium]